MLLNRAQLLHSIPGEDHCVFDVSVQPDSYKGDVFAAASGLVLSIFDIRRSTTGRLLFFKNLSAIFFTPEMH